MRAFRTPMTNLAATGLIFVAALLASPAEATWRVTLSGDLGYSVGVGQIGGLAFQGGLPFELGGEDNDVSPLLSGAIGLEIPMDELTPWRMPFDWRLPDWPIRWEIEAAGLRDWQLETRSIAPGPANDAPFNTSIESWSLMSNWWFDIPLRGLYRPISATSGAIFRQPRLPRLRAFLKPASIYAGAGVGVASLTVRTVEAFLGGETQTYGFAYQAGAGFGYQLTERVNLGFGYRYLRPSNIGVPLGQSAIPGSDNGVFEIEPEAHEARVQLRIRLADLPYPWR